MPAGSADETPSTASEPAQRGELCGERRDLGFDGSYFESVACAVTRRLCLFERFVRPRFIEIGTSDRGIRENGHEARLHFEQPAGDEDELLRLTTRRFDPHYTGLDAGQKRRVPRVNAELARFAREHDELGLT